MKKSLLFFFLLLSGLTLQTFAQGLTITGKVTSAEDGEPLPGVTVKVKGTSTIAVTNSNGIYTIKATPTQTLVFSYISMVTQEITVGTRTSISLKLATDASKLSEVVITSYNIARDKKSLGYSTPTVKGDEVSQTQREDFFGGLQGRVPGLSVNSTNGSPGASAQIVLRGFVSISGDNNALIVVDGVPINNTTLNQTNQLAAGGANQNQDYSNRAMDINPNDIETYTIMKGPEATALYGSAGASGAILITTKKGKSGKSTVTYNNSFRVEHLNKFPEIQQVYNSGTNGVFSAGTSNFEGPRFVAGTHIYDNIRAFYQNGFAQKHNLSFEGGSDKFTYRWSNEYSDTKGTVPTTTYTRFSSRLTGTAEIWPMLKLTTTFNYINSINNKVNKGPNGELMELLRFSSAFNIKDYQDANGNRILHLASIYSEFDNPLWDVNKDPNQDKTSRILANTNFLFTPAKWLSVNAIIGADIATTNGIQVYNGQSYKGSGSATNPTGGQISQYQDFAKIFNGSLTATTKQNFGQFNGTFIVGATFNDFNQSTTSQLGTHLYDPNFYSINNTAVTLHPLLYVNRYRTVGAFAQAVLGYKSLIYLTLSGRIDGSSRLATSFDAITGVKPPNHPYYAYPSASLAFNFTDLESVKNALPWLEYGKLRASYALTGKDPWRVYALGTNYAGAATTGGGYALSYYGGNASLKPETSKNFEAGIELQFLKNRIGIDFDFYNLRSVNQIINPRLSYGTGYVLELLNGGTVQNRGMEIQLKGQPVRSKDFNWNTTFNFARNRGTVLSIANQFPELYDSDTWVIGNIRSAVAPGYSTGNLTGTRFDRNKNGQILIDPSSGLPAVSDGTFYPIGDRTPKFTLGWQNQLTYKSFTLSFLWDLRYGGDVVNGTEYEAYTKGISVKTLDRETPRIVTGVLKDGQENTNHPTPNTIAVTPYSNSLFYSTNVSPEMFIEHNIKALRLRDITLNYDFPRTIISRIGWIQTLGIYFTVTDAFLFSNYSGTDPESNATTATSGGIGGYGIDYGNVGKPIAFNLGLRVRL
ncbi:MAG: SusC/RagA family TonB-linked outer membrane protein [Candidatus Pedobacter colombiensis]|uniref:SusC/RagA family TonB-linked outer membrane protein n=1 Tax=Candidatus Pedobacter colombiensis TaxID=3121371 RepID=A0AAJ6B9F1_9SPHI|nr:SusC/RagA family TonB-linked outer membrane protein [Pedobacter sp.]WEK21391.1 MAG: SusC/RagA family TonB-linked outer membrane protein [Pedobacter sp.]